MVDQPSDTLFIGDIPLDLDDNAVGVIFGAYGKIKSQKLLAPGGHGKRAAIISFEDIAQATWIVENLNGNIPQGLSEPIQASFKKPGGKGGEKGKYDGKYDPGPYGAMGGGGGGGGGMGPPQGGGDSGPSDTLFIGELPGTLTDEQLVNVFTPYGSIKSHKLMDPSQYGKRAAIISFGAVSEAQWIVENLNGNIPQGLSEPIKANFKRSGAKAADKGCGKGYGAAPMGYGAAPMGGMPMGGYGAPPMGGAPPQGDAEVPSENLFIGELPATIDDTQLAAVFGAYGTIKSHKLMDPSALGKRAAIITFGTVDEAAWIVNNLNGNIPQGLQDPIKVNYKRGGKGFEKGGGKGMDMGMHMGGAPPPMGMEQPPDAPSENVFIGELPASMDDAQLLSVFGAYGGIKSHKLLEASSQGKRAAIVTFGNVDEAAWVVNNLNGNIPQGLTEVIKCNFKRPGKGGGGGCGGWDDGGKGGCGDWGGKGGCGGCGCGEWGGGGDWGCKGDWGGGGCKGKGKGVSCFQFLDQLFNSGVLPGGVQFRNDDSALFVHGLPRDTTDFEMYQLFSVFGGIAPKGLKVMLNEDGYTCKGYGFVNFLNVESSQKACEILNGTQLPDGSMLKVSPKQQGGNKDGKGKAKGKDWGEGAGW